MTLLIFAALASIGAVVASPILAEQPQQNLTAQFAVKFDAGAMISLRPAHDPSGTEYVQSGRRLGDVGIRYRRQDPNADWQSVDTATLKNSGTFVASEDGSQYKATYQIANGAAAGLASEVAFAVQERAVQWTLTIKNSSDQAIEIGDLSLPLPISRSSGPSRSVILKHSYIGGHGSFLFWMRSDSKGPFLVLLPSEDTSLEYWDSSRESGYRVYVHSAAAGAAAKERGTNWRQPHTSLTLAPKGRPGDTKSYTFRFRWAEDYDGVRQALVDEGGVDVHVVPGMTVPSDLCARFALRTKQKIDGVEAEFPQATKIESLGANGDYHLYQVRFSQLGENRLTVRYGDHRHTFLEFFCTEPLEILIKKRAAFLARSQHRDPSKWYSGLITDWNMETQKLLSPDDYAPIPRSRVYAVTCDDPGLGKPAFLASKNAEYPVQSEVEALDYYMQQFIWGGLQRTTDETYPYALYGIPNWKVNRDSNDPGRNGKLHLWRIYDYPHVIVMYFNMYRVARDHPQIKTALPAREYLQRAYGTAQAMFTVPHEIWPNWSPYGTGFYNEVVIVDLIDELDAVGLKTEAATLRDFWERKVKSFVNGRQDLFRSEYAFDSTGFESTHALAKYAMQHADQPGQTVSGIPLENAQRFLETQMAANLFCRGWLEPAYYYLGSDYRGGGGNAYTLTYMSQMGGWSVLDYALHFADHPSPYLRLGYASFLSAWALMNTGTPESNYGYWYPGKANDGGAGGGFEPAPFGMTWLGQPHHRGSWYYACEIDLGYCGALRTAATVLADDPIFGRFCFGGDWHQTAAGLEVVPKDGLRRRFHALLDRGRCHLVCDSDRFAAARPLVIKEDLSEVRFALESDNPTRHTVRLHLAGLPAGRYALRDAGSLISTLDTKDRQESTVALPLPAEAALRSFTITRTE
jgi:hypothetical protein